MQLNSKNFSLVVVSSGRPKEPYYTYDEFFKSVRRFGYEPMILGSKPGQYRGLGSKPKLVKEAILNKSISEKYLIFCDCYDLVFIGSPFEVMLKFYEFNAPFVCSSEKNCFPGDLKDQFPEAPTSYKYLNSGFIVAETEAMLTVLESMDLDNVPDDYFDVVNNCHRHINDQFQYMQEFIKQPVKMVLDYKQELCNTLHQVTLDEFDFSFQRIVNKETGSQPLTAHFNGSSKTSGLREPILEKLGL
jgi:hypothetical protein